ncbi:hypothetical protein U6G28_05805 [Actinomycetaceae bacterium MB13-C1-2]|nr:hypothetical protein U6G28_05805 [Actinomycetaceae bacterium MB13-C1-2]
MQSPRKRISVLVALALSVFIGVAAPIGGTSVALAVAESEDTVADKGSATDDPSPTNSSLTEQMTPTIPDSSDVEDAQSPEGTGANESGVEEGGTSTEVTNGDDSEVQSNQQSLIAPQEAAVAPLAMPTGRNYLVWQVKDETGNPAGGMTVAVQGPRSSPSNWGTTYNVTDCTVDPCAAGSMDQDPRPGYFAVQQLIGVNTSGTKTITNVSSSNRYRISPVGSGTAYQWQTTDQSAIEIPGSGNTPTGWPSNGPWDFTSGTGAGHGTLLVKPIISTGISFCDASVANDQYFALNRTGSNERTVSISVASYNAAQTAINSTTSTLASSVIQVPSGQTANGLGITKGGIFYFTTQNAATRAITVYRFQPGIDSQPFPIYTMDLLSPTTNTVVAGAATIYNGTEEFYFAYFSKSDSPGSSAVRFHLYRYSAGNGSRTGEVAHVDVPIPQGSGFDLSKGLNGDFAFDTQKNIQFVVSNWGGSYGGKALSGVVPASVFQDLPGRTNLADVPTIYGTANAGGFSVSSNDAINGVTFTSKGNAIIQLGSFNSFADPTTIEMRGTGRTLSGNLVDLASCGAPATITVLKNVEGARVAPTDQFKLSADRVTSGQTFPFDDVTTQGQATGVQAQKMGPFVLLLDGTFNASESFSGTPNNWDSYQKSYECYEADDNGNRLTEANGEPVPAFVSGSGASLSFPLSGAGKPDAVHDGTHLVCAFTNRGTPPAEITIHKDVLPQDGGSGPHVPKSDWTVGAVATKTGDSDITVTPASGGTPLATQQTDADGNASWSIDFAPGTSAPSASVNVKEVMGSGFSFVSGSCLHTKADGTSSTVEFDSSTAVGGLDIADVKPGDTVSCNFLNGNVPTLELCKSVQSVPGGVLPDAASTDWLLSAEGVSGNGGSSFDGAKCGSPRQVASGEYKLTETVDPGGPNVALANAYDVSTTWSCERRKVGSDSFGPAETLGSDDIVEIFGADEDSVAQDAAVRCTITNQAAEISLLKRVEGHAETTEADFLLSVVPESATPLPVLEDARGINAIRDFNTVTVKPGERYTLSERSAKWGTTDNSVPYVVKALEKYQVSGTCPATPTAQSIANSACWAAVDSGADEEYTVTAGSIGGRDFYRFTNVAPTPPDLPSTGGLSSTQFLIGGFTALGLALLGGTAYSKRRPAKARHSL